MKNYGCLFLLVLAFVFISPAQRLIPLITPEDQFPFHSFNDEVYCVAEWNDQLAIAGKFTQFNQEDFQGILLWNGTDAVNLTAEIPDYDILPSNRITALCAYNGDLLIGAKVTGEFSIFRYNGASVELFESDLGGYIRKMMVIDNMLYVIVLNSPTLHRFDGNSWSEFDTPDGSSILDIDSFDNGIAVCTNSTVTSNVLHFAADNEWTSLTFDGVSQPQSFYSTGSNLFVCGHFEISGSSTGAAMLNNGILQQADLPIPSHVYRLIDHHGKFYSIASENANSNSQKYFYENDRKQCAVDISSPLVLTTGLIPMIVYQDELYLAASDFISFEWNEGEASFVSTGLLKMAAGADRYWLEGENVRARFDVSGAWFHNAEEGRASFEVPINSGRHTIYSSAPWVSALLGDQMYAAVSRYEYAEDGWSYGPVSDVINADYALKYYRLWSASKDEIEYHQLHYSESSYITPENIQNWPAHGNMANGEAHRLAPFVDANENGLYEPWLGDYPEICGDEAVYVILNDKHSFHFNTGFTPMNLELHVMMCTFTDQVNFPIDNTVFAKLTLVNRSDFAYENLRIGVWNDWDIGSGNDDFVGVDSLKNLSFGYNGDNLDEASSYSYGYGTSPPAQALIFLNHAADSHVYYTNSTNSLNGDPEIPSDYFYYMRSKFRNGQNRLSNFDFAGSLCENVSNTETSSGISPGDRRSVLSSEDMMLDPGDYICFNFAYFTMLDSLSDNFQNACQLSEYATDVIDFYNMHIVSGCDFSTQISSADKQKKGFNVFPNPGEDVFHIQLLGERNQDCMIEVYDALGTKIMDSIVAKNASGSISLDASSWPAGMYFVKATMDGNFQTIRWIKQV